MSEQAPFIPPTPTSNRCRPSRSVFRVPGFLRLWLAQVVSSLGDWIGLVAILALATKVSSSGTAVGLVMVARMLPGFLLAPLGGALVDRWNRKVVMVSCDIGRAGLLALLPFFDNLLGLVIISFLIEVLTLLWGPAKDATVPNIVKDPEQLASANSLVARRGVRHVPARRGHVRRARRGREVARRFRRARAASASTTGVARDLGRRAARSSSRRSSSRGLRLPTTNAARRRDRPDSRRRSATSSTGWVHPVEPAGARRDDRSRGWAHRRWRGRSARAGARRRRCSAAAAARSGC